MCPLQLDLLLLYFYIQQIICITHTNQSTYSFKDRMTSLLPTRDYLVSRIWEDRVFCCFLRKEVIQPHLPVRLPCYDFAPVISLTFGDSLTRLGHRLRVLPTPMA